MDENKTPTPEQDTPTPQPQPAQPQPQPTAQTAQQPQSQSNPTAQQAQPRPAAQTAQPQYQPRPQQAQPQYQQNPQYGRTQNGGYQQNPYGYPPQYAYVAPQTNLSRGKGGGWISFLRVLGWILFAVYEILVVIGSIAVMIGEAAVDGMYLYGGAAIAIGLVVLLVGTLIAFIMIAAMNVSLDKAQNIRRTATNTAEMAERLDEINKKLK